MILSVLGLPARRCLLYTSNLVEGQVLVILFPEQVHTVQEGETLQSIARRYGVTLNSLFRNNIRLKGSENIFPGETIVIRYRDVREGEMEVNA